MDLASLVYIGVIGYWGMRWLDTFPWRLGW
jgi:hypothetical protein